MANFDIDVTDMISDEVLMEMVEEARQRALKEYNTTEIQFVSNRESWRDCLQIIDFGKEYYIMLHYNVGKPSHAINFRKPKGDRHDN